MVKGCSTLFVSLEDANKKALEIANRKLSESIITKTTIEKSRLEYDPWSGDPFEFTDIVEVDKLKFINSKQELMDLITDFDYVLSTSVVELFVKEELIQQ